MEHQSHNSNIAVASQRIHHDRRSGGTQTRHHHQPDDGKDVSRGGKGGHDPVFESGTALPASRLYGIGAAVVERVEHAAFEGHGVEEEEGEGGGQDRLGGEAGEERVEGEEGGGEEGELGYGGEGVLGEGGDVDYSFGGWSGVGGGGGGEREMECTRGSNAAE